MSTALVTVNPLAALVPLVTDTLRSQHSKTAYSSALAKFFAWVESQGGGQFSRALVHSYRSHMEQAGSAPSTINQALAAIRCLAREAADNGYMDATTAFAIARVKGTRAERRRAGLWLTIDQLRDLFNRVSTFRLRGARDAALLALLAGCGLRRQEAVTLEPRQLEMREGRWVLIDVLGKGSKERTVPVPAWALNYLQNWIQTAGIQDGKLLRRVNQYDQVSDEGINATAAYKIVERYGRRMGLDLHPHDLRRTYAKLNRKHGGELEQIQLLLGHSSITTTDRYLGTALRLDHAPCDLWTV